MKRIQKLTGFFLSGWITLACWAPLARAETQEARYLSLYESGDALRRAGEFRNAIERFEKALTLACAQDDTRGRLDCLMSLGTARWNVGQIAESSACFSQALSLSRRLQIASRVSACSKILQIHDLYGSGKRAFKAGRYQHSIRQFEAAISLAREMGRPEFELKCLRQLSLNYFDLEKMIDFVELNRKALGIARALKHRPDEARCLNNIGLYFFKANRYSNALALYEDALRILKETGQNEKDQADCLNNISLIYLSLGNYERALRCLKEAMEIDTRMNDIATVALDLKNMGTIYRNRGENRQSKADITESLKYYADCLKISEKNGSASALRAELLNNIGLAYSSLADYSTALSYFRSALDEAASARRAGDIGAIACNIGQAYLLMSNFAEAKTYFIKSIELAVRMSRDEILWESYLGLGQCFEAEKEIASALSCYEKAADIIDSIRQQLSWDDQKTGFARDKWKVYDAWVNLLFQRKQAEPGVKVDRDIWRIVERAKARALSEGLSQSEDPRRQSLDPESLRTRNRLTRNMSLTITRLARRGVSSENSKNLLEELEKDEDKYAALMNRFEADHAAAPSSIPSSIIPIEDVQRGLLGEDSAVVEFFLGDKRSFVILLTGEQVTIEPLPPRSSIEDSLKAYLKILSTPPHEKFQGLRAGRRIYEELFSALDRRLQHQIQNLIIIPDGVLCYLPFETLVRGGIDGRAGKFLVESFQVSYAPSVSSLSLLARRRPADGEAVRILAIGSPVYAPEISGAVSRQKTSGDVLREIYQENGFDFSPLPYSKKEIQRIAAVFPNRSVDVYMGSEAREEVIKKNSLLGYRIIHFACHGFLDENAPQRTALVLSLDEDLEEDGFLQAREIYELRLNADLVVLSACQTGRGRLETGEGILGLPRMFFYAGARSTISSLWKISDRSTSSLMQDFYRLLAGGAGKARALREAKLRMLRSRFSHPFYWAGFILHGDYRTPWTGAAVSR